MKKRNAALFVMMPLLLAIIFMIFFPLSGEHAVLLTFFTEIVIFKVQHTFSKKLFFQPLIPKFST